MKAIALWQPWASLWCSPAKIHETRHWSTNYRGWMLVHAAKRKLDDFTGDRLDKIMDGYFSQHWGLEIPFGALIGMVDIVECGRTEDIVCRPGFTETDNYECGDFSPRRYGWRRGRFKLFDEPIPYRGAQGLFDVPQSVFEDRAFKPLPKDWEEALKEPEIGAIASKASA